MIFLISIRTLLIFTPSQRIQPVPKSLIVKFLVHEWGRRQSERPCSTQHHKYGKHPTLDIPLTLISPGSESTVLGRRKWAVEAEFGRRHLRRNGRIYRHFARDNM